MMWFNGIGWSWADCVEGVGVMVVLWGAVAAAIILAVGFLTRQRRDPLASGDTVAVEYVLAEGTARRSERDNEEWHRRLM